MCRHQQAGLGERDGEEKLSSSAAAGAAAAAGGGSVSAARSMKWEEVEAGGDIHPAMIHFSQKPISDNLPQSSLISLPLTMLIFKFATIF